MPDVRSNNESELKSCLEVALAKENLENISVEIVGRTEKGSGYVCETLFVTAKGNEKNSREKKYNLALKCSRPSPVLSESKSPLFLGCVNEGNVYKKLFPLFTQFQLDRGVEKPFDSFPKCYGVFSGETKVVIALENLRKIGYDLWDQKIPLTRDHINLVIEQYAKYHATSVALKEQEPEKFQDLVDTLLDVLTDFTENTGFLEAVKSIVEELGNFLKDDIQKDILEKWMKFSDILHPTLLDMVKNTDGLQVIMHGDSWNNNFMYKYEDEAQTKVSKVAILDWQVARLASPIFDLSYYLFACSSKEVIEDLDAVLKKYHTTFLSHLEDLSTRNPALVYPLESFLTEWKKYAKYGLALCFLPLKVSYTDKDNLPDLAGSAEKGEDFASTLYFDIKDVTGYKNRIIPIVKYAVESGIVD